MIIGLIGNYVALECYKTVICQILFKNLTVKLQSQATQRTKVSKISP